MIVDNLFFLDNKNNDYQLAYILLGRELQRFECEYASLFPPLNSLCLRGYKYNKIDLVDIDIGTHLRI